MTERAIDLTDGENNMKNDLISRQDAIDALNSINCCGWVEDSWAKVNGIIEHVPSALPDTSRIENILHGKSAEEQYDFLWWLMQDYGIRFTDTRSAVIEWLRGERNG